MSHAVRLIPDIVIPVLSYPVSFPLCISPSYHHTPRDPEAAIPIFAYQALQNLPHLLPRQYSPHRLRQGVEGGFFGGKSGSPGRDFRTGLSGAGGGMVFEGLYHEPSLGHLVGLVRHYIHRMEVVSKEEVRNVW